jgi:hypothetical protein
MPPKDTVLAAVKLVPVIVTVVPPPVGPEPGLTAVILGGAAKVNRSADEALDVPPAEVTVMSTAPAASAGLATVIWVAEAKLKFVALTPPKETVLVGVKLLPVIVTCVPPPVGPEAGLIAVTLGGVTYVNWSAGDVVDVPVPVVTAISRTPAA